MSRILQSDAVTMTLNLPDLPMELIWHVIGYLDTPKHLGVMLRVNRLLYQAFTKHLYRVDIKHPRSSALLWAVTHASCSLQKSLRERIRLPEEDNKILQDALWFAVRRGDCPARWLRGSG
jgi:hypothetical protein